MPAWLKTKRDEDAWSKAKHIVARQKGKKVSDLENGDFALVTTIAKNILSSSFRDEGLIVAMANVQQILERRARRTRKDADQNLPGDAQDLIAALGNIAAAAGEAICALRTTADGHTVSAKLESTTTLCADLNVLAAKVRASVTG